MWTCPHCDGKTDDEFQICWVCRIPRGASVDYHENARVLVSSTPTITTHEILEYVGPVFGETIYGANFFRDFASGLSDVFGGRSENYEQILSRGRTAAIHEMRSHAERLECNAIVGMSVQYEPIGRSMFLICVSGTAVRLSPLTGSQGTGPSK